MTLEEIKKLRDEHHAESIHYGPLIPHELFDLAEAMLMLVDVADEEGEAVLSRSNEHYPKSYCLLDGPFLADPAEAIRAAHEEWKK